MGVVPSAESKRIVQYLECVDLKPDISHVRAVQIDLSEWTVVNRPHDPCCGEVVLLIAIVRELIDQL